jgi:hypothetical protein
MAWGMNYIYYKQGSSPHNVTPKFLDEIKLNFSVSEISYPYYNTDKKSSKSTVIKAFDNMYNYDIIIKNKDGKVHPRTLMINNYKAVNT